MIRNPLVDKDFLRELDQVHEREIYAKVISLNLNEEPVEEITGRVTSGSVNIDGNSAIRRTCNLTLVAEELNIHDYYWGMKTKFKLYIGMRNEIDSKYPEIIWFPQGIFLISTFNTSQAVNNYTISIQGKDKMTLLNGEYGGMITALTHDFGQINIQQLDGSYVIDKILVKDIIRNAVHTFANEPLHNIIINDVEDYGVELLEYKGDDYLFILLTENGEATNLIPQKDIQGTSHRYHYQQYNSDEGSYGITYNGKWLKNGWSSGDVQIGSPLIIYDSRINNLDVETYPTRLKDDKGTIYTCARVEYGSAVGYRMTGLTYPGELILQVGSTITSLLDKIKTMLGEFEYFYDLSGKFVFQRKQTYIYTSWNGMKKNEEGETYVNSLVETSGVTYSFENSNLVTAFSNAPNLSNLRNDFSIWGEKESVSGVKVPIHLRYAIDKKPTYYTTYDGKVTYTTKTKEEVDKDIAEGLIDVSQGYVKKPNEPFVEGKEPLSEDWWDAYDWAEYYKECTGAYPKANIGSYTGQDQIDLSKHFAYRCDKNGNITSVISENNGTTRTDTLFTINGMFYSAHGKCSHGYESHLIQWQAEGQTIYVYKPELPEEVLEQEGVELIPLGDSVNYECEWRELIYQMAVDYSNHGFEDDFLLKIAANNPKEYPNGLTRYEQYYTDILGFWRDLYNPLYEHSFSEIQLTKKRYENYEEDIFTPRQCVQGEAYTESLPYLRKTAHKEYELLNISADVWKTIKNQDEYYVLKKCDTSTESFRGDFVYYIENTDEFDKTTGWSKTVLENPEKLVFWFDFLDAEDGNLSRCSARIIGDRPKAENDTNVKAIYYRDTPSVIFVNADITEEELKRTYDENPGYTIIKLQPSYESMFSISAQGKSSYDVLNEWLYSFSHCAEQITITALPIYYLEPNTRIFVNDKNSGINGEYIVNRITLPLQYQGTMSISATKVAERLY